MKNNMETITLKYEDYLNLLEGFARYKAMKYELEYIINTATYDKYYQELGLRGDVDLVMLLKKYAYAEYNCKLKELREEYEKESENNG